MGRDGEGERGREGDGETGRIRAMRTIKAIRAACPAQNAHHHGILKLKARTRSAMRTR